MSRAIELAHEPPFRIGQLEVFPSTHEIRCGPQVEVVEPRVMQVLIALAHAHGAVLTRDELVFSCWNGRIVGDDAIHRVLSRLRRLTDGIANGVFRVETITKVGYRLTRAGDEQRPIVPVEGDQPRPSAKGGFDRRTLIMAGGAAAAVTAGGAWLLAPSKPELLPEAEAMMVRGRAAMRLETPEYVASAVSNFREAARLAPESAEPWGALAFAYLVQLHGTRATEWPQVQARARSAADRALAIDPDNVDALIVMATLQPYFGKWSEFEAKFRPILKRHPTHGVVNMFYGVFLGNVGRPRAALPYLDRAMANDSNHSHLQSMRAQTLWSAGRLDEADAAIDAAAEQWPRNPPVWWVRNRILGYTGRAAQALAFIDDFNSRPTGIPEWNFELNRLEAVALQSRTPTDIDAALKQHLAAARKGVGFAEIAVIFAGAVGRLDEAFEILMAYYFNRGFEMSDHRYSAEQGRFASRRLRNTWFLFLPTNAALRADPRFGSLVKEIGLEDFWQKSGAAPDYRRY